MTIMIYSSNIRNVKMIPPYEEAVLVRLYNDRLTNKVIIMVPFHMARRSKVSRICLAFEQSTFDQELLFVCVFNPTLGDRYVKQNRYYTIFNSLPVRFIV